MSGFTRTQTILLLTFLIIVWAVNWPISKLALNYAPPILFTGIRALLAGFILLLFAIPRYRMINLRGNWPIYLISALLNVVLYHTSHTIGLNYMPSGLVAAIVFLQPVLVGLFAWVWLGEHMNNVKIFGIILGFTGVAIITSVGLLGHISLLGIVLALLSALSWASGTIYVKRVGQSVDPIWLVTLQFIVGGLAIVGLGSRVESWSDLNWHPTFVACLLFISMFVLAAGWLVYFKLLHAGEASKVASFTFLIPAIAVLLGTVFMNEPFRLSLVLGLVMILVSIYYVNRAPLGYTSVKPRSR